MHPEPTHASDLRAHRARRRSCTLVVGAATVVLLVTGPPARAQVVALQPETITPGIGDGLPIPGLPPPTASPLPSATPAETLTPAPAPSGGAPSGPRTAPGPVLQPAPIPPAIPGIAATASPTDPARALRPLATPSTSEIPGTLLPAPTAPGVGGSGVVGGAQTAVPPAFDASGAIGEALPTAAPAASDPGLRVEATAPLVPATSRPVLTVAGAMVGVIAGAAFLARRGRTHDEDGSDDVEAVTPAQDTADDDW